jgi:chemotaxis signal transduction protein
VSTDLIVFELQDRRCAVELSAIQEVIPLGPVTPVPAAPPAIAGAVNVHGQVVALLDLGLLLGLPSAGRPRPGASGLLASAAGATVVLLVTRVCEVLTSDAELTPEQPLTRAVTSALGELELVNLGLALGELERAIRERPLWAREAPRGVVS